jgi:cytochrome P450
MAPSEVLGDAIPDDVMSGLLVAEVDNRRLDERELLIILNQLLVGGNETTTSLITNLFWRLLDAPDVLATLRNQPDLDVVAVEESLRLDSPVLGLYRTAVGEQTLGDVTLPDRAKIMATFGAANRDPAVFDEPDEFRLDRDPEQLRKHVAFGLGHHFCPGAHLSRLEARIVLRLTLDRFPALRATGDAERIAPFILWGRKSLPVTWN